VVVVNIGKTCHAVAFYDVRTDRGRSTMRLPGAQDELPVTLPPHAQHAISILPNLAKYGDRQVTGNMLV
jgi:hypothetical protein